ncbi:XLF-domain-containing protein [Xylona heveae TC161]|uniref:Non-homologous end-joining factor 1 n=1 Tax=Xylona heveae (strain CBS 132557 / TC161) TaxID=1328760 RepID=A0A165I6P2_XYLHT|nr:XLF-domain-containing protein [Xylona heveae TC161]KZF24465.1 XLF-domain-containing protein [Xylona heveae TC161]
MSSRWTILQNLSASIPLPPLLLKCNFEPDSYTILVSDLRNVWSESLGRRQIIRRALNNDTSIDPSEDPSQLRILLEKLQIPLTGADNGTTLRLLPASAEGELIAKAKIPLPEPLRPLEWEFNLVSANEASIKEALILPLLATVSAQSRELDFLIGLLKEKDHVIERLVDKLDVAGVEINRVFPAAIGLKAGKRGASRAELAKYVRGMGEFEEATWKKDLAEENEAENTEKDLLEKTFSTDGLELRTVHHIPKVTYSDGWWRHLSNKDYKLSERGTKFDSPKSKTKSAQSPEQSNDSDAEFQRQETPPRLRERPAKARASPAPSSPGSAQNSVLKQSDLDDETTEDDDDLGGPSAPFQRARLQRTRVTRERSSGWEDEESPQHPRTKKSGTIGQKSDDKKHMESSKHRSPSPSKSRNMDDELQTDQGSETEGETEGEAEGLHSPRPASPLSSPHSPAEQSKGEWTPSSARGSPDMPSERPKASPPRQRLGTIGGPRKAASPEAKSPSANSDQAVAPPSKPSRSRLGVIGGRSRPAAISDARSSKHTEELGSPTSSPLPPSSTAKTQQFTGGKEPRVGNAKNKRSRSHSPPEAPPEEAPEERANRRREELRKQMEERAKAPAKKKRKF